jgi:hypothetical protein
MQYKWQSKIPDFLTKHILFTVGAFLKQMQYTPLVYVQNVHISATLEKKRVYSSNSMG